MSRVVQHHQHSTHRYVSQCRRTCEGAAPKKTAMELRKQADTLNVGKSRSLDPNCLLLCSIMLPFSWSRDRSTLCNTLARSRT